MKIVSLEKLVSEDIINMVIKVLKHGGLVVFPSDTVYGLLVDATNNAAVSKLIEFKNRPPETDIGFCLRFDNV
jgi:L-threonylcarbamoyladenylate synthase